MWPSLSRTIIIQNGSYFGGAEKALLNFLLSVTEKNKVLIYAMEKLDYHQVFVDNGFSFVYPSKAIDNIGNILCKYISRGYLLKEILRIISFAIILIRYRVKSVHINIYFRYCEYYVLSSKFLNKNVTFHIRSLITQIMIPPLAIKHSNKLICVSNYVHQQYVGHYPSYSGKFITMYDGVYSESSVSFTDKGNSEGFMFLAPAVNEPRKGLDIAINAFKAFVTSTGDMYSNLVIAGGTPPDHHEYARSLRTLADSTNLRNRIIFLGHVDDMRKVYKNANVVLMLSRDGEALGLVGIEAQMMSCLLIGNNLGAVKEYLTDAVTGLVPDENTPEAIAKLMAYAIENWSDTFDIRRQAFQHAVGEFSTEKTSVKLLSTILN